MTTFMGWSRKNNRNDITGVVPEGAAPVFLLNRHIKTKKGIVKCLVSKKFALLKKPVNPSRFRTHPAVPELSALCIILAVFLKGGKNVSADSA